MKVKLPRQVIVLGIVSLFTDIASEMLYPVAPIFLTVTLGASMAVVGIIEGLAEVVAGFLKGYFGMLSDKIQKRSIFVTIGYSLSAIVKPLPGLIPGTAVVAGSRVLDRVGKGIRTAPRDALLAGHSDGNSGTVFGFHRAMDTLGAALGPVVALILLYYYPGDYVLVYLVAFVPSMLAVGATLFVKDKFIAGKKKSMENYADFWKEAPKQYRSLLIVFTLFSFVNSSDVFLILKTQKASSSETLAIIGYIFYNLVYAGVSLPAGKIADKIGKKRVFIVGLAVFSLVYFGFAFFSSIPLIFLLFTLYGLYAATTEGVVKAWVSDLVPDHQRGSAIGLFTMLSSLAVMAGSAATGVLWDAFGSQVPFLVSGIVAMLIAGYLMLSSGEVETEIRE